MAITIDTSGITKLRLALAGLPKIEPWFVAEAPWGNGDFIVSGHPDPHLGKYVADTENFDDEGHLAQEYAAFIAAANPVTVQLLLAVVDEARLLLDRSMAVMKALHESAQPDESTEGVPCVIQPEPFHAFVDAHADLLYKIKHLGHEPEKRRGVSTHRKQYLIHVGGAPGPCFYIQPGDEDDQAQLHTTHDSIFASRWDDFVTARKELRLAVSRHPTRQFKLDVVEVHS